MTRPIGGDALAFAPNGDPSRPLVMMTARSHGRRPMAAALMLAALCAAGFGAPVLAAPAAPARPAAPRQDASAAELKAEWDEVLGKEAALVRAVEEAQVERLKLTAEIQAINVTVLRTEQELQKARLELAAAQRTARIQTALRRRADKKVAVATDRLRRQIVASYVTGGADSGMVEALLKATNGEEAGQAMAYSSAVVDDTDSLVRELEVARSARRKADRSARRAASKAAARRDDVDTAKRAIEADRDDKQRLVDQVNAQYLLEAQALRQAQGRKALIESRINAENRTSDGVALLLAERQQDQEDWTPGSVTITTPLPGVEVSSPFGMRHHPILGIDRLHAGADLGGSTGDPIHAPADAVVVLAEVRGGYGNTTVLDHGHSLGTLYGHQSRILVKPGDIVRRGEVIGYMGSTGLSTGPHLHFETRIKGLPIDPEGVVDFASDPDYDALLQTYEDAAGN